MHPVVSTDANKLITLLELSIPARLGLGAGEQCTSIFLFIFVNDIPQAEAIVELSGFRTMILRRRIDLLAI
jgi:hypothetical protein